MRTLVKGFAAAAALTGAATGWAATAAAETLDGPYTITVTDGRGAVNNGSKQAVFTSPCGPDCVTFNAGSWTSDVRLQGPTWTGVTSEGLTISFDSNSMAGTMFKPATNQTIDIQVSKINM
jgi:hypothetical protein